MLLLLVRHGLTEVTGRELTGRRPGFHLSEPGRGQAESVAVRLEAIPLAAIYSSPMERCLETAAPLANRRGLAVTIDADLNEVDYGDWAGRLLKDLARQPAWKQVQRAPADFRFPGGEAIREAQARAAAALERIKAAHPAAAVAVFTHADIVRMALAHVLGMHLDVYQRLTVAPASISALWLGDGPGRLLHYNDLGGLDDLRQAAAARPARRQRRPLTDAGGLPQN